MQTELMFYPEVSHVKGLVSQETDLAQTTTVTSGRKCSELLGKQSPLSLLVKTLLESSVWKINPVYGQRYSLAWKAEKLYATIQLTTMKQYTHDKLKCSSVQSVKILKKKGLK